MGWQDAWEAFIEFHRKPPGKGLNGLLEIC